MNRRFCAALLAVFGLLLFAGPARTAPASDAPPNVTIAYQPGISYATLIVIKQQGVLEKMYPGTKFDWRLLSNGATIRDGFLAGQIHIGAGGAGPFLVGWDRGVGYRLIASMNEMNLWLVAKDPKIKTVKDLSASSKIGVPSPDAIQAVVLRKAAQDQLGNAHVWDASLVAIQHPLGVQALLGGQLDAHFTSPPFQQEEVDAGGHVVLKSYDVMGKATFNSIYTTDKFAQEHPQFIAAFAKAVTDATKFITTKPDETAEILAKDGEMKVPAAQFKKWMASPEITFTTTPHGFMKVAQFMKQIGFTTKVPSSMSDIELPLMKGAGD
ncbi:MAG: ABC transporter substrate-binding protein [Candidatus Velthaea sp.]